MTEITEYSDKNTTGIKHILVCKQSLYCYYLVDIRKNKIRYKKRFKLNENGLNEAVQYVNEINNIL